MTNARKKIAKNMSAKKKFTSFASHTMTTSLLIQINEILHYQKLTYIRYLILRICELCKQNFHTNEIIHNSTNVHSDNKIDNDNFFNIFFDNSVSRVCIVNYIVNVH